MINKQKIKGIFKTLLDEYLIILPFIVLLFFQIFNSNKYGTNAGDIEIPIVLAVVIYIGVFLYNHRDITVDLLDVGAIALLFLLAVFSTLISSVVTFNKTTFGLFVCMFLYVFLNLIRLDEKALNVLLIIYKLMVAIVAYIIIVKGVLKLINVSYGLRFTLTIGGVDKDPNYVAGFLCSGLALALYSVLFEKGKRLLNLILFIVIFVGIVLTGSRGALVTCFCSSIVLLVGLVIKYKRVFRRENLWKLIIFFSIIAVGIAVGLIMLSSADSFKRIFDIETYFDNIRLSIWAEGIKAFYRNPIIGSGMGASSYYALNGTGNYSSTHNAFLDIIADVGILGMLILICIIAIMIIRCKKNRLLLISYLVASLVSLFFLNGFEGLTFWLPMIIAKLISNRKPNEEEEIIVNRHSILYKTLIEKNISFKKVKGKAKNGKR